MKNKLITVIIPSYNSGLTLKRCLNSFLGFDFLKVIIVNDGSTDNSLDILNGYVKEYPDIFFVINQENAGISEARKRGVDKIETPYFCFCDSDDVASPKSYKIIIDLMKKNNTKIGFGRVKVCIKNTVIGIKNRKKKEEVIDVIQDIEKLYTLPTSFNDKIFDSSLIELFDFSGRVNEDIRFMPWLHVKVGRVSCSNEIMFYYIRRNGSLSMANLSNETSGPYQIIVETFEDLLNRFKNDGMYDKYKEVLALYVMDRFYERLFFIKNNNKIVNKKEMIDYTLSLLINNFDYVLDNKYANNMFNYRKIFEICYLYTFALAKKHMKKFNNLPITFDNYIEKYNKMVILKNINK